VEEILNCSALLVIEVYLLPLKGKDNSLDALGRTVSLYRDV
jgi:hypothetical protein